MSFAGASEVSRFNPRALANEYGGRGFGIRYPSPFFDVAQQFLPENVHQLHLWCRYYFLTNPVINAAVSKMAEYPITPLLFDSEDGKLQALYKSLETRLNMRQFQVEVGLDFFAYGNCFVSVFFPLVKFLVCKGCAKRYQASKNRSLYTWKNQKFFMKCPECRHEDYAKEHDVYIRSVRDIGLVRWNPEYMEVKYSDITGKSKYYFKLPTSTINDIKIGDPDTIETLPYDFLEAARTSKALLFGPGKVYHLKRPTIAQKSQGWGTPLILPLLKDAFYLQIMKKAQEALLLEHVVPMRVIFPGQSTGGNDSPYGAYNLVNWKAKIDQEFNLWRRDCVSPSTWIDTGCGLVRADSVSEGDFLKNHEGGLSTVKKVWRRPLRFNEVAYSVKMRGLRVAKSSVFSENHPLLVGRGTTKKGHGMAPPTFVRLKDLRVGDYVGFPVVRDIVPVKELDLAEFTSRAATQEWIYVDHTSNEVPEAFEFLESGAYSGDRKAALETYGWSENQFKIAQIAFNSGRVLRRVPRYLPFDTELAWAIGLYLAEGSSSPKQIHFGLNVAEEPFAARLDNFLGERFGCSPGLRVARSANGMQVYYSSKVAAELFSTLCPGTAHTKAIPKIYMSAEDDIVVSLLRGLINGDGCFHNDGRPRKKITFSSVSLQLAEGVRQLLLSLRIPVGMSEIPAGTVKFKGRKIHTDGGYRVQCNASARNRLLDFFTGDPPRELNDVRMGILRDGYFWHKVEEIVQVECEEVIGFEMDKEVSVYLDDDTEAHGTFCSWGMAGANSSYIPILPVNVGFQQWGGQAKALILHQEFRFHAEQMLSGAGIPPEFIFGGLSWSASNTALRALENTFLGYNRQRLELVSEFIFGKIAAYMQWPKIPIRFDRFRMADDLQRSMFYLQLNQAQKISDRRLLEELGEDFELENTRMGEELKLQLETQRKMQVASADIQGEAALKTGRYQAKVQKLTMLSQMQAQAEAQQLAPPGAAPPDQAGAAQEEPPPAQEEQTPQEGMTVYQENAGSPNESKLPVALTSKLQVGQGGVDLRYVAQRAASYLRTVKEKSGPEQMYQTLEQLQLQMPQIYPMIVQLLNDTGSKTNPMDAAKSPAPLGTPQKDISRAIG